MGFIVQTCLHLSKQSHGNSGSKDVNIIRFQYRSRVAHIWRMLPKHAEIKIPTVSHVNLFWWTWTPFVSTWLVQGNGCWSSMSTTTCTTCPKANFNRSRSQAKSWPGEGSTYDNKGSCRFSGMTLKSLSIGDYNGDFILTKK